MHEGEMQQRGKARVWNLCNCSDHCTCPCDIKRRCKCTPEINMDDKLSLHGLVQQCGEKLGS